MPLLWVSPLSCPKERTMKSIIPAGTPVLREGCRLRQWEASLGDKCVCSLGSLATEPSPPCSEHLQRTPGHSTVLAGTFCSAWLSSRVGTNSHHQHPSSKSHQCQSLSKTPAKSAQTQPSICEQKGRKRQQQAQWCEDWDGQQ